MAETVASRRNQWPPEIGHPSVRQFRLPLLPGPGAVQVGANGQASVTHPAGTGTGRDVLCRTRMISDCSTRTVSKYQPGRGEKGKRYMTKIEVTGGITNRG